MFGRPTCSGSPNIGGAPLIARSFADLTAFSGLKFASLGEFIASLRAAAAESAGASLAGLEIRDHFKGAANDRYQHELRQSFHRLQFECCRSSVPATDHQRSLIVRID